MVKLTLLNSMTSPDFEQSLDIQKAHGIEVLDLKDQIFGKSVLALTNDEARRAAALIADKGLSVFCLSTQLFHERLDKGEEEFVRHGLPGVDRAIALANVLKPEYIRILPAIDGEKRPQDGIDGVRQRFPWLAALYREAIDCISAAGHRAIIENEYPSILASPEDVLAFFDWVDRPDKLLFTWDVQNMWQMGAYPSVEVWHKLKPVTAYFHVKGGQEDHATKQLKWKSSLEDATWPIADITREVLRDGSVPVICLNPSHGKLRDGYDYSRLEIRDLIYMQGIVSAR